MKNLNSDKLYVDFLHGVTYTEPILFRKYTLTHSDITGDLFLDIGLKYSYEKISPMRDEVLGEWRKYKDNYYLFVYCYIGKNISISKAKMRYEIFVKELPLALQAIIHGDKLLFNEHKYLNHSPIYIYFNSIYPCCSGLQYWGKVKDYKI